jgi:hypothetical protein
MICGRENFAANFKVDNVEQLFPLDDTFVMNQLAFQPKIATAAIVEPPLVVSFQAE